MRVLISGATGFVGNCVLRQLLVNELHVGIVSRRQLPEFSDNATVIPANEDLYDRVREFAPDVTIHCATCFLSGHTWSQIPELIESNVTFGTQLVDAVAGVGGSFLTLSTAWQHYEGKEYSPVNLYAATKQAFDDVIEYYQSRGVEVSRVTLFDTYGPGDQRGKIISRMMGAARSGRPLMATSGNQLIDLTYIEDVAEAIVGVALGSSRTGPIDAVVRSGAISLRDVALVMESAIGRPVPIEWGAQPDRDREMMNVWDFGEPLTGWTPKVELAEGLRLTWQKDWLVDGSV